MDISWRIKTPGVFETDTEHGPIFVHEGAGTADVNLPWSAHTQLVTGTVTTLDQVPIPVPAQVAAEAVIDSHRKTWYTAPNRVACPPPVTSESEKWKTRTG